MTTKMHPHWDRRLIEEVMHSVAASGGERVALVREHTYEAALTAARKEMQKDGPDKRQVLTDDASRKPY